MPPRYEPHAKSEALVAHYVGVVAEPNQTAAAVAATTAADRIIQGLIDHGMSSYQSGMDSVRNLTGSPIAGLDPHELLDTRWGGLRGST
jgi:hypothetical protein